MVDAKQHFKLLFSFWMMVQITSKKWVILESSDTENLSTLLQDDFLEGEEVVAKPKTELEIA